ncbi:MULTISPECIES: OsmC family protein [unclassified Fusibacter]|uniref:OsmC family protein n=1 Tax=unclassified Fusibacter TaxID=2624464 RepID=UPI001012451D|nr:MULTISPECIES: OsmC family protein [unclassified Fusibacter]MCK8060965.1 OsmC family protein [Fusibacter sp. A2]NPE23261.1 OsmC family protein [Fusibacter sp. A1]RXV59614.1 OsmC family peroxiredoxin [Fusibacter sp. A1]
MAILKINTTFTPDFVGELVTSRAVAPIGAGEGRLSPYDMLLGALSSCLYATFLGIAEKKRIAFESIDIEVTAEKRTEVPTTLKWCKVVFKIKNAQKQKGLVQAGELAAEYCSIYQTLAHVAEMSLEVEFID